MEQYLYIFLFLVVSYFFIKSNDRRENNQNKGLFALFAGVFFLSLAFLSFNIEIISYQPQISVFNTTSGLVQTTNATYNIYNAANSSLQPFLPFGICLSLSIYSFLNMFICFTQKAWNEAVSTKPTLLKTDW